MSTPAIRTLPVREAIVVRRHDFEGETYRAIAADFGVAPCRAVQLHTRALQRLRMLRELPLLSP